MKKKLKIIQSAWSCASQNWLKDTAGWFASEYHLMSWTLSCLKLKEFYDDVALCCDAQSHRILIEKLKLPYSEVIINLDELNSYHHQLWALPKIKSYSLQKTPFIHVDGDVLIWKKFPNNLIENQLIAQNKEYATDYYGRIMASLEQNLIFFPDVILKDRKNKNPILAYNMGIFGGNDIEFIQEYCKQAFEFVDKNQANFSKIEVNNFNIFFEQYLLHCLVEKHHKNVGVLFKNIFQDNGYKGFGTFSEVPYQKTYLHLLGTYKRNQFVCENLANQLRMEYPEQYYNVIELFKKSNFQLVKDFYFYQKEFSAENQLNENKKLINKFKNDTLQKYIIQKEIETEVKFNFKTIETNFGTKKLKDFKQLVTQIKQVLREKFSTLSWESIYARDVVQSKYFIDLFENEEDGFNKLLILNDFVLIKSKFNWDFFFNNYTLSIEKNKKLSVDYTENCVYAMLPECTIEGFSLVYLDGLDIQLIELLKHQTTINQLIKNAEQFFESEVIEKKHDKFKKIITTRIKTFISKKIIRRGFSDE